MVIQQSRPELVPKLVSTIGDFEMAVVPRSIFEVDSSLLVCKGKSSLMTAVEEAKKDSSPADSPNSEIQVPSNRVLIVDAMAVLQGMKKGPGMLTILHLKETFLKKIGKMSNSYDEVRIIFDHYLEESLKSKTRANRATSEAASKANYYVHDQTSIKTISLKELFSSSRTKNGLTKLLSEALLKHYEGSSKKYVVSYHTYTKVNLPHTLEVDFQEHGHEEADTLIPLHAIYCLRENTFRDVHVCSPDTGVFILLMDLASNGHLGALTKLTFCTGIGKYYREIDIRSRVKIIGIKKARGLIGLHNFTGADWGGKFVGISKKTWADTFFSLENDDEIVDCFCKLGQQELSQSELVDGNLPLHLRPFERFVCIAYSAKGPTSLSTLRWEMFQSRNLECEMLPPTVGILLPHIIQANFVCMRDKSYVTPKPSLPSLEDNGWLVEGNTYLSQRCLLPPAPKAVLELVKCGCRISCTKKCSCVKNKLPCTALCKCYASGCHIYSEHNVLEEHDKYEDEEDKLL